MLKSVLWTAALPLAMIPVCRAARAERSEPEEIIALERAALNRWGRGDPQGFIQLLTPEMTYFDPYVKKRIDGYAATKELLAGGTGKIDVPRYEMIDPKVQVYGDVAILTFNLVNYTATGKATTRWNSTEIYRRADGKWKLIHSHWSLTTPDLK